MLQYSKAPHVPEPPRSWPRAPGGLADAKRAHGRGAVEEVVLVDGARELVVMTQVHLPRLDLQPTQIGKAKINVFCGTLTRSISLYYMRF